jgi:RNA polymerase sigma factor (sigma-70 family)
MVYATCKRILGSDADVEDVVQECFEILARGQHASPIQRVGPWLHGLAVRRALQHVRSKTRRKQRETRFAEDQPNHSVTEWDEIYEHIDESILELTEEQRVTVVSHFMEGKSHATIAKELGISRRAVGYRINKAVEIIARRLNKQGITISAAALTSVLTSNLAAASSIPATLSTSLGKVMLAYAADSVDQGTVSTGIMQLITGALLVKKTVFIASFILISAFTIWLVPVLIDGLDLLETEVPIVQLQPAHIEGARDPIFEALIRKPPETDEATAIATTGGTLSGRVYDATTGESIAGAVVRVRDGRDDGLSSSVPSNAFGDYALPNLAPGDYTLVYDPVSGYRFDPLAGSKRTITMLIDSDLLDVDIALEPEALLAGTVVDATGQPVAGAEVEADHISMPSKIFGTDIDGRFSIHGLGPSDRIELVARFGKALSRPETINLPSTGREDVVLVIERICSIAGHVVDAEGAPVPNIIVHTSPAFRAHGISDSTGAFVIAGLSPGAHVLLTRLNDDSRKINLDTGEEGLAVEMNAGQHLSDVVLVYDRPYSIAGRISDADGKGIAGAQVSSNHYSIQTSNDGSFLMDHIPAGRHNIWVSKRGYKYTEKWWVKAGNHNVDLVMKRIGGITGRVVQSDTGYPIEHFEIVAKPGRWHPSLVDQCNSVYNSDGRFQVQAPEDGALWVFVKAPGYAPMRKEVRVKNGALSKELVMALESSSTLEGIVVAADGTPIQNAAVFCNDARSAATSDARSSADGRFVIKSVPGDLQRISVVHSDFAGTTVAARAGQSAPVRVVLRAGAVLEGTVFHSGAINGNTQIYVEYLDRPHRKQHSATLEADGTYRIDSLPTGEATVIFSMRSDRAGHALVQPVILEDGETTIADFLFAPAAGVVEGQVYGIQQEDVLIQLYVDAVQGEERYIALSGVDGAYHFENVSPGPALLYAETELESGEHLEQTIQLEIVEFETVQIDVSF